MPRYSFVSKGRVNAGKELQNLGKKFGITKINIQITNYFVKMNRHSFMIQSREEFGC